MHAEFDQARALARRAERVATPSEGGQDTARRDPARIQDLFLARLDSLERRVARELGRPVVAPGPVGQLALDLGREAWMAVAGVVGRLRTRPQAVSMLASLAAAPPVDSLGVDPRLKASINDLVRPLARAWLGLQRADDVELPSRGATLVLLNRSAWPLPTEALVAAAFVADCAGRRRDVYALWDADVLERPWLGTLLQRSGVLAATRANCQLLLERGATVIAFPEGVSARSKTYQARYRLGRFDDACLFEAAVAAGARIVPGALLGSEESYPLVGRLGSMPITAAFPWAGLLGVVPLPVAWKLRLGSAVEYAGADGDQPSSTAPQALADAVRVRMQAMLGELLAGRRSIVGG